jgi:hypothetical protein
MRRQSCASFIYDTAINRHVYLRYGNLSPYLSTRRQSCASFIRAALIRCHVYLCYGNLSPYIFIYATAILCHVHLRCVNSLPRLSALWPFFATFIYAPAIYRRVHLRYGNLFAGLFLHSYRCSRSLSSNPQSLRPTILHIFAHLRCAHACALFVFRIRLCVPLYLPACTMLQCLGFDRAPLRVHAFCLPNSLAHRRGLG